ncbi:hypothetical protein D5R93_09390 [Actinomyces lilanjuaniae]|uniref:AMP-binding enzyme C-terminal domain-containing protein n=1 Tax=Actinomyces lilanjuaniae TaxID=2321394 RepID=A0ABM6Z4P0_9ACTO|nr:hypothetical protein D5R93_09390 [Actinomyces lilanjuaniae]
MEVRFAVEACPEVIGCVIDVVGAEVDAAEMVAYIAVVDGFNDLGSIQSFVSSELPEYMLPDRWVIVDDFPLNSNGKCDLRLLRSFETNRRRWRRRGFRRESAVEF